MIIVLMCNFNCTESICFSIRARADRENPEELPRIAELQKDLDTLKAETRQRLNSAVDTKYQAGLPHFLAPHRVKSAHVEPTALYIVRRPIIR